MVNPDLPILEIDLNDAFTKSEDDKHIVIDCKEYKHYTFINYDIFASFIKLVAIHDDNYYKLTITKQDHTVSYTFNSIDKIIYYIYNYHTKKNN